MSLSRSLWTTGEKNANPKCGALDLCAWCNHHRQNSNHIRSTNGRGGQTRSPHEEAQSCMLHLVPRHITRAVTRNSYWLGGIKVNFFWVVRKNTKLLHGWFEEKVMERGIIVREWVNQHLCKSPHSSMGNDGRATSECRNGSGRN